MPRGEDTRSSILDQAFELASELGLEGLTIGALAKRVGMSKSGLYAHFESKEDLQSQVLDTTAERFIDAVVAPALKRPRGLPRVKALFELWLDWYTKELSGGCPFVSASVEYDDRPGPVRDTVVKHMQDLIGTVARAGQISVDEGHFHADLDVDQFAFEFWAILLAYHHFSLMMKRDDARDRACRAFAALIRNSGGA